MKFGIPLAITSTTLYDSIWSVAKALYVSDMSHNTNLKIKKINFDPTWMPACVLWEAKDTQGINSGGYINDNGASDFCTPQFHAIMQ